MVNNIFSSRPLGAAPTADKTTAAPPANDLDTVSRRWNVPINVLQALQENGSADSEADARELAAATAKGEPIDGYLTRKTGSAETGKLILNRAYDIADTMPAAAPVAPAEPAGRPKEANALRDVPAAVGASVAKATGSVAFGAGEAISAAADGLGGLANSIIGDLTGKTDVVPRVTGNVARPLADAIGGENGLSGFLDGFVSEEVKADMADLLDPKADLFDPSTYKLGPRPTVRGAIFSSLDVFGSMAPIVIASMYTGPVGASAMGGAMSGGFGGQEAERAIDAMATTINPDGRSQLETESSVYQRHIAQGMQPDEAREATKASARRQAAALAAIPGALGGAATSRILHGASNAVTKLPFAGRVAATAGMSGAEEAVQEVAEGMAARTGINSGAGVDRSVTEGTLNEALLGAIGGAPMGALGGAFRRDGAPAEPELGAPPAPELLALPPPALITPPPSSYGPQGGPPETPGDGSAGGQPAAPLSSPPLPAGAGAADAPTQPPAGPIEQLANSMPDMTPQPEVAPPAPLFPEHKEGGALRLQDPTGELIDATFMGESAEGVVVRVGADLIQIPAADFAEATRLAKQADEAAKLAAKGDKGAAPVVKPADPVVKAPTPSVPVAPVPATPPASLSSQAMSTVAPPAPAAPEEAKPKAPMSPEKAAILVKTIEDRAKVGGWTPGLQKKHAAAKAIVDAAAQPKPEDATNETSGLYDGDPGNGAAGGDGANLATGRPAGNVDSEQPEAGAAQQPAVEGAGEGLAGATGGAEYVPALSPDQNPIKSGVTAGEPPAPSKPDRAGQFRRSMKMGAAEDMRANPGLSDHVAYAEWLNSKTDEDWDKMAPVFTSDHNPFLNPISIDIPARRAELEAVLAPPAAAAPKKGVQTGLDEMGGDMASGMGSGLRDYLWGKVEAGDVNEAGQKSAVLQAAKMVRDRNPAALTRENFDQFTNEQAKIEKGDSFQADMRALVDKWAPPAATTSEPKPDTTKPALDADKVRRDHAQANMASSKRLPGRQKQGVPMAEIEVGKDADGKFMVRSSLHTPTGGFAKPFGGAYDTAEEAEQAARAEIIKAAKTRLADKDQGYNEQDKADARKILSWLNATQDEKKPDPKPAAAPAVEVPEWAQVSNAIPRLPDGSYDADRATAVLSQAAGNPKKTPSWKELTDEQKIKALEIVSAPATPKPPAEKLGGEYKGIARPDAKATWDSLTTYKRKEALRAVIKPTPGVTESAIETALDGLAGRTWGEMEGRKDQPGWDEVVEAVLNAAKPKAENVPTAAEVNAAAAQTASDPTPAQAEAENYKTGKVEWRGLTLSIENKKGSIRSKVTPDGKTAWSVKMPAHYGRILKTVGADGDHVDFYMGPEPDAYAVFIIDQIDADTRRFDEHKVMIGFPSQEAAVNAYGEAFSDGRGLDRLGEITATSPTKFIASLDDAAAWKKPFGRAQQIEEAELAAAAAKPAEPAPAPSTVKESNIAPAQEPEAAQNEPVSEPVNEPVSPAKPSASSILSAALDDVFGADPEPDTSDKRLTTNAEGRAAGVAWAQAGGNEGWAEDPAMGNASAEAKAGWTAGFRSVVRAPRAPRTAPPAATKVAPPRAPRTAAQAASSAVKNTADGVAGIVSGLNALFGDPSKLNSGLTFDAETYEKAKPMFTAAVRAFGAAGQDVMDMARAMVRGLAANGLQRQAQENMRPYLERYISDLESGTVDPFAEETDNEPAKANPKLDSGSVDGGESGGTAVEDGSGASGGDVAPGSGSSDAEPEGDGPDVAGGVVGDGAGSAGDPAAERSGESPGNFVITPDFPLGEGTDGQKITANLAAIRLVKELERENRYATRAEQEVLARYVGWGGLKRVFNAKEAGKTTQFGRAQAELRELLTPAEYRAAGKSTADAHYTSREVVSAMWEAMRGFGFDGGRVLEPTIGAGNFVGLQPADLSAKSEWFASELDKVTGLIAKHLYPDATVFAATGFQNAPFRPESIDVAIGNPPFGRDQISSKLHPELPSLSVHNYIIAKTGLLLRPGGIMGMVVTHNFLDTANPQARTYLAQHFNFLGAVRLPNTAFKANAGTEVTTDIVWFQKRRAGDPEGDLSWLDTDVEVDGVRMNGYFAANPQMMLGRPSMAGTMYGTDPEFTLENDGRDMPTAMAEAMASIDATLPDRETALVDAVVAPVTTSKLAIGEAMLLDDGRVMLRADNDADGNAVIAEVTPETPWGAGADDMVAVHELAELARDAIRNGTADEGKAAADRLGMALLATNAFSDAGKLKATAPTGVGKAGAAAMGELMEGVIDTRPYFGPKQEAALAELRTAIDKKRLGKKFEPMKGLLSLRKNTVALLAAESSGDKNMEKLRKALATEYRAFVAAHGFVNNAANEALTNGVPGTEAALESRYKKADKAHGTKESAEEAAILSRRIITPYQQTYKAESAADGIHISLRERGRLDLGFIAELTGKQVSDVLSELTDGKHPRVFRDPARGEYVIADEYLSGNLAEKIEAARNAGEFANVPHLEAAMPPPKEQSQITPSIRSLWMPTEVFQAFLREMGAANPKVTINQKAGTIEVDEGAGSAPTDFGQQFQTSRRTPFEIFTAVSKGRSIVVVDRTRDGTFKNEQATQDANAAAERMAAEFQKWAYLNPQRAAQIVDAFNTKMNVVVPRKHDGVKYLTQVGNNPTIQLRNSQKNGAWRMMLDQSTLLHHVVGAGKTFTAITAIMERKRLGLSRKTLVAVPNHIVGQWARDFYALYPGANILVASEKDFTKKNRRKLIARIATGEYDAVIVGHSSLKNIQNSAEETQALMQEQLADLQESLEEAQRNGSSRATVAQIQARITKYEERIDAAIAALRADDMGFDFSQMGIDNLVIDEAHEFKNLEYSTAADRLVGMNSPDGSQRALDLYIKTRGMMKRKGAVGFLTGTPVSNSLVEIFTIMKYLAPQTLRDMGLMHYDAWASTFVQSKIRFEYTASQKLKERNVMAGLVNLGPLSDIYRSFADVVMRPEVEAMYKEQMEEQNAKDGTSLSTKFPTPKVKDGGRQLRTIPASPDHEEFTDYLVMRMDGIKRNASDKEYPRKDNALWVLSDARKASIDIRTVDPHAMRLEESKVVVSGKEVLRIAKAWEAKKGTQLIFADSSVPLKTAKTGVVKALKEAWERAGLGKAEIKARLERDERQGKPWAVQWGDAVEAIERRMTSGVSTAQQDAIEEWLNGEAASSGAAAAFTADSGFSFYDDMRDYLVENGLPADQIAFIHDYDTPEKKARLFEMVNAGEIRVLLGSTFKMGAGTNVQQRAVALHHIDAPWRPSDMEQREGRIIRQGNDLYAEDPDGFEVEIIAYATEKTSDVVLWQVLERKAAGIEQFLNATADSLIDEDGSDADSYATFMAQSTGNPIFLQKMEAEKAVRDMVSAQSSMRMVVGEARRFMRTYEDDVASLKTRIKAAEGVSFDDYPEAGKLWDDYRNAVGVYEEAKRKHEADADAVRAANAKLPEGTKKQKLPELDAKPPTIFPETGKVDRYAAALKKAIEQARDDGEADPIKVGSGTITISSYINAATPEGARSYDATLRLGGHSYDLLRDVVTIKNPFNSRALIGSLMPDGVNDIARRAHNWASNDLRVLQAAEPDMREKASREIDTRELERKGRELTMLKGRVRVAEVEAAQSRQGTSNRFADMDDHDRSLARDNSDDKPLLPENGAAEFELKNAGVTYTAKFGAKGEGFSDDGKRYDRFWFEATADDAKRSVVIVEARKQSDGKEGERTGLEVVDTYDTGWYQNSAWQERRARSGAVPGPDADISDADLMKIEAAAAAELRAVGISRRVVASAIAGSRTGAAGWYRNGHIGLRVKASATQPGGWRGTLDHEIIHALRDAAASGGKPFGLFSEAEWKGLIREARKDAELQAWADETYPDLSTPARYEEMVAELYREWAQGRRDMGPLSTAFDKIKALFTALANAMRGRGFQSAALTMERIASGTVGGRGPDGPGGGGKAAPKELRASITRLKTKTKGLVGSRHWKNPGEFVSGLVTDAMTGSGPLNVLALVPGRPLFDELGKHLFAAKAYLRGKEEMDSLRNAWHARSDAVAQDWMKLRNANPRANDTLMDLMHRSTISGINPALSFSVPKHVTDAAGYRKSYDALQAMYKALPADFQKLYGRLLGEYTVMADDFETAVLENMQTATEIAIKRAERAHRKELKRIADEGLTGQEKKDATEEADRILNAVLKRGGWGSKARMAKLRKSFESNRLKGPYFPLARFGKYFVTVRDSHGAVTSFSRFEKEAEQKAEIRRAEAANPGRVEHGVIGEDGASLRAQVDPTFVADVEGLLSAAGAGNEVMDAIWQRWLETLPDQSIRTTKIHRKNRLGFSNDAFRAFGKHMFHGAHQLARLKYGLTLEETINDAREEAARAKDPNRATAIVNEMQKRHDFAMNPTGSSGVAALSSLAFVWYLGATPGAAIANLSQTTVVGIPLMSARFKKAGVSGSAAALGRASKDFFTGRGNIEKGKTLKPDEVAAMAEGYRRGTIDKTQAHDLASVAETGIEYNALREKWMRRIGWMFHHAERMNREVTFLASYRLAKAEGLGIDAAIDAAADMTWKIHFDYQNTSRPRFMQNDIGKVLTTFRNFTVSMIYRLFRDTHQALHGATKEDRAEARTQLIGITLSMMAHAGIRGTWGFGLMMMLLGVFFPGGGDDAEEWLQDALLMEGDGAGVAAWNYGMGAALNGVPGQVAQVDLKERIGMPNLWFRGPGRDLEGADLYAHYVGEVLGPVFGIGQGLFRGAASVAQGEVWRGTETAVPKALRDLMKTGRYATEGVETKNGDDLMENVNPYQLLVQALGFTPAAIAERYDVNSSLMNAEKRIMDERKGIHKAASEAMRAGEPIPDSVMRKIRDFNETYPTYPITGDSIRQSLQGRVRASQRNEFGVGLNPKLNDQLRASQPPTIYN